MKEIRDSDLALEITSEVTLVYFWANWCAPCKISKPVLEKLEKNFPQVNFVKVDTEKYNAEAFRFGVFSIPALLLFKDGKLVAQTSGYKPLNELTEFVLQAIEA